jgi:hypothetical protein
MQFKHKIFLLLCCCLSLIYSFKKIQVSFLYSKLTNNIDAPTNVQTPPTTTNTNKDLNEFFKIHESMSRIDEASPLKRISFNEGGLSQEGYGNRLNSITSSLLVAVLTGSQLMVRWPEVESFVELPIKVFTNKSVIQSKDSSYEPIRPTQSWRIKKEIDKLMQTKLVPNKNKYIYIEGGTYYMEICTNPVYFDKLLQYGLVREASVTAALDIIKRGRDASDYEKQEKLFQVGFEVGGNLINKFWMPSKQIMSDVDAYVKEMFLNKIVIGFQLRFLYMNAFDPIKFFNCALDIENEYRQRDTSLESNSFRWFLTGDSQEKLNQMISMYPKKAFSTSKYSLAHIGEQKTAFHRTLLDVELMSKCNELIFTGGSTYGWLAAMKMLKLPYYIEGKNLTKVTMNKCVKTTFSNPPSYTHNVKDRYGVF